MIENISVDNCHAYATLYYMNVVMDADCLIKLTKAQLKEDICKAFAVIVPTKVIEEVMVDAGTHPECTVIQRNLDGGLLATLPSPRRYAKGEDALLAAYEETKDCAGIASDDKRFIRKLRLLGTPYLTPAVMLLSMVKRKRLTAQAGLAALALLAPMISDAEVAMVKIRLESMQNRKR